MREEGSTQEDHVMGDTWSSEHHAAAVAALQRQFGLRPDLTRLFPSHVTNYKWSPKKPAVLDSRIHAKNNIEYHGLERHAWQYHATCQYDDAFDFWMIAALWRNENDSLIGVTDEGHEKAQLFCLRHALFNRDLHLSQTRVGLPWPLPSNYGITEEELERGVAKAEYEMEKSRRDDA
jgi:hypothetical protein